MIEDSKFGGGNLSMITKNIKYEDCISEDNRIDGLINASAHKGHRRDVRWAFMHVNKVIDKTLKQLEDDLYRFPINEPKFVSNRVLTKNRFIVRPDFVNFQVFQHTIMNPVKEDMLNSIYKFSCGSLPNRGALYGRLYIEKKIKNELKKKKTLYALKFDIAKFFENMPTQKVEEKLARRYRDKRLLLQFHKVLQANILYYEGEYTKVGLPIGYYTSQWLANWYLSDLDNFIKHKLRIKIYVRYMDDMLIISENKEELQNQLKQIIDFIHYMGLEIKSNYQVFKFVDFEQEKPKTVRPIDFLGYKFYHDRVLLRKKILKAARRKAMHIYKKKRITFHEAQSMLSYLGYFKHSDTQYFFDQYIKPFVNVGALKKVVSAHQKKLNNKIELPDFMEIP